MRMYQSKKTVSRRKANGNSNGRETIVYIANKTNLSTADDNSSSFFIAII